MCTSKNMQWLPNTSMTSPLTGQYPSDQHSWSHLLDMQHIVLAGMLLLKSSFGIDVSGRRVYVKLFFRGGGGGMGVQGQEVKSISFFIPSRTLSSVHSYRESAFCRYSFENLRFTLLGVKVSKGRKT